LQASPPTTRWRKITAFGTPELAHGQNVDPEQTWPAKFADHYFLNVSNIEQCRRTQKSMLVHHRPFGIDL